MTLLPHVGGRPIAPIEWIDGIDSLELRLWDQVLVQDTQGDHYVFKLAPPGGCCNDYYSGHLDGISSVRAVKWRPL